MKKGEDYYKYCGPRDQNHRSAPFTGQVFFFGPSQQSISILEKQLADALACKLDEEKALQRVWSVP